LLYRALEPCYTWRQYSTNVALVFHAFESILRRVGNGVSEEVEQRLWVEALARRIKGLGLADLARVCADGVRPLGFLGAQALLLVQPLLTGLLGDATVDRALALLESPRLQENLVLSLKEGEG
jgi:hypothetical protein